MAKRSVRGDMMRQAIAREAARLMIEHGHEDYGIAKRKAAERFGVTDLAVLPNNTEIEEALAEHQRLFAPEEHASELSAMRSVAVGSRPSGGGNRLNGRSHSWFTHRWTFSARNTGSVLAGRVVDVVELVDGPPEPGNPNR